MNSVISSPNSMMNEFEKKSFSFIGFEPSHMLENLAITKFLRIHSEAPSDSSALAYVKKTLQGFEGVLHIRSAVGSFVAKVVSEDPQKAIEAVSQNIRTQLQTWKSSRRY